MAKYGGDTVGSGHRCLCCEWVRGRRELVLSGALFKRPTERRCIAVRVRSTTGRSKAAALTHAAVVFQSACKIAHMRLTSADVYMHAPPLFHVGGLSSAHAALQCAARHVFPPKFAAADFLAQLRQWGVSSIGEERTRR